MAKRLPTRQASIDSLKERMARDPFSRAFLQLAEEYRREGQFEEAVRVCLEGLGRHPTYHTARISLGRTYLEMGDLESARKALSEVLELAPENHLAGKLLAEVQRRMGDVAGAAETYRAILLHYADDREVQALLNDLLAPTAPGPAPQSSPTGAPAPPAARPAPAARPGPAPVAKAPISAPAPKAPIPRPRAALAPGTPSGARQGLQMMPPAAPVAAGRAPEVDYRPEDLAPAAPAIFEASAAVPPEASGRSADALQTNTLAELYLRQGLTDRAMEVYRSMLRVDPRNDRARRRLEELAGASPQTPAASDAPRAAIGAPAGPGTHARARPGVVMPPRATAAGAAAGKSRSAPGAGAEHTRATAARLERWLEAIRRGSRPGREAGRR